MADNRSEPPRTPACRAWQITTTNFGFCTCVGCVQHRTEKPVGHYGVIIRNGMYGSDGELVVLDRRATPTAALNQAMNKRGPGDTYTAVDGKAKADAIVAANKGRTEGHY